MVLQSILQKQFTGPTFRMKKHYYICLYIFLIFVLLFGANKAKEMNHFYTTLVIVKGINVFLSMKMKHGQEEMQQ